MFNFLLLVSTINHGEIISDWKRDFIIEWILSTAEKS